MELTYRGRAKTLVDFYNDVFQTGNLSDHILIGKRVTEWQANTVSIFVPRGIDYSSPTALEQNDDKAISCTSANLFASLTDVAIITSDNTGNGSITYNGQTYYRTQAVDVDDNKKFVIEESDCSYTFETSQKWSFLLYVKFVINNSSEDAKAVTFRKLGFIGGTDVSVANCVCYENIPAVSVVKNGSLEVSLVFAF